MAIPENNLKFEVCVTPEVAAELEKLDRQVDEIMKDLPTYKPVPYLGLNSEDDYEFIDLGE